MESERNHRRIRGQRRGRGVRGGASRPSPPLELNEGVMAPRGGPRRSRRVRGGASTATPPLELEEGVVPWGVRGRGGSRRGRGARGKGGGTDSDRPGPRTIEDIKIEPEADMSLLKEEPVEYNEQAQIDPLSSDVKVERHDEDIKDANVELAPSSAAQHPCQSLREQINFEEVNYGSEADSGESDEEELPPLLVPRAQWSILETPLDAEVGVEPAEPEPASTSTLDDPPTATDQPWSLFDFDWKPFPNAPVPPESRRERFSHNDVGPTAPCVDPYDIFISIWDRQFMEYIASETNRYAQQVAARMLETNKLHPSSRISKWRDTTADELYIYFAIVIAMGIVVKSRVEDYWSQEYDLFFTPGFGEHMSGHRFALLSKCLHFRNNEDMCALNLDVSEAKIFKVQPVLSHLNSKFQSMYRLRQNIVLDESLLKWKCWTNRRQLDLFRDTMGIKSYEICEPQTGYLWRFEVHDHSNQRSPPVEDPSNTSTPAIVLRLIHGLEGKGHTLWMESFYNSPCLARRLKSLGLDCAGTLRTDRKYVPQALHSLTTEDMRRGQLSVHTSGDVDVVVWKEYQRVAMISTYHGNAVTVVRGVTKPILIHDFSVMMGGVDKKDVKLTEYPIERNRAKSSQLPKRSRKISSYQAFLSGFPACKHTGPAPESAP